MIPRSPSRRKQSPTAPQSETEPRGDNDVFLNVPYDEQFVNLFVAYVGGLAALGLKPRASLEIPGGKARLDKIADLIARCAYSVHDLSRVELDLTDPPTPRFNMPFELGIVIGHHRKRIPEHTWFVFESTERRLKKSLSDLGETDPYIHDGTPQGILSELLNAFVSSPRQPTMQQMLTVFLLLRRSLGGILSRAGSTSPFKARAFKELLAVAKELATDAIAVPE